MKELCRLQVRIRFAIIDMCNFKYDSNMTKWGYNDAKKGFEIVALEDIPKGAEVTTAFYEIGLCALRIQI